MLKIFLCHASEDKPIAETIQLALVNAGHIVFFDEHSLPPGGDYHERIEKAIRESDLFVFLISTNSLKPGKYTLSELSLARELWPSPIGRVLPVNLHNLPSSEIPPYLSSVTLLTIKGNPASEVRSAVAKYCNKKKKTGRLALVISIGSIAFVISLTLYRVNIPPSDFIEYSQDPITTETEKPDLILTQPAPSLPKEEDTKRIKITNSTMTYKLSTYGYGGVIELPEESRYLEFVARQFTPVAGAAKIDILLGGADGELLQTFNLDHKEPVKVNLEFPKPTKEVTLLFRGGSSSLVNLSSVAYR